jgi:RIP metalloprotease RseP
VYAPRFSIGFGPTIFKFRRGETEYVLAWLPLGGYVRMASRHDAEASFIEGGNEEQNARAADDPEYDPEAMVPFGPKPVPENRWFESKPLWQRIVIMLAGVTMNALLALVVATVIVLRQGQNIVPTTVVGTVRPTSTTPALAQLHAGDTIRAVNGTAVTNWNEIQREILRSDAEVRFATNRGDVRVPVSAAKGAASAEDVADAVLYYLPPVIDSIVAGDPASQAGLQRGDSIVSINGETLHAWPDMVDRVGPSAGKPLTFVVSRRGAFDTLIITPKSVEEPDQTGATHTVGKIGAAARNPAVHIAVPVTSAIAYGFKFTMADAGAVFKILHQIGNGQQSVRQLGGPIAITRAAVEAARSGIDVLFRLIALLSINVAVLNLLPIPILDGGQILINVLESAKGSPFSVRTREYILRAGLFAIGLLFVIVMYNDTRVWIGKLFGSIGRLFGA